MGCRRGLSFLVRTSAAREPAPGGRDRRGSRADSRVLIDARAIAARAGRSDAMPRRSHRPVLQTPECGRCSWVSPLDILNYDVRGGSGGLRRLIMICAHAWEGWRDWCKSQSYLPQRAHDGVEEARALLYPRCRALGIDPLERVIYVGFWEVRVSQTEVIRAEERSHDASGIT